MVSPATNPEMDYNMWYLKQKKREPERRPPEKTNLPAFFN